MGGTKNKYLRLILCYVLWGFQPLYWALLGDYDPFTILGVRIIFSAIFAVLLLALGHRLHELWALFRDRATMKLLIPATVFIFADWAVYIAAVSAGRVLDVSLGYYINPLVLFLIGAVIYRERATAASLVALAIAAAGVVVSTLAYGSFPALALVIALNWAVYAALKKNVRVDGVLSIAVETILMTPPALIFLLAFRTPELGAASPTDALLLIGSGVVTALPMFLYSDCVSKLPLTVMCFAQYLSPTFGLLCGCLLGEVFTKSQLMSLAFFVAAIIVFSCGELRAARQSAGKAE